MENLAIGLVQEIIGEERARVANDNGLATIGC